MNWKNISVGVLLTSLTLLFPLSINSKLATAQDVDENVTVDEITEETSELIGQTVSVRGEVTEIESPSTFVISGDEFLGDLFGEDEVLVFNVADNSLLVLPEDDAKVQVTGEVGTFILSDIEETYNIGLDPALYVDYENQPVIFAESVALSPDPGEVTEDPTPYYNQRVAIEGEVEDLLSLDTFTLDEDELIGGSDLLVVNMSGEPLPQEDETVTVTGVIRPFVLADLERDYDLTWDLDLQQQIEAEYTEKPVLIVDSIYPSAEE